jgi:hypothetical protein
MTPSPADIKRARDLLGWGLLLITVGMVRIVEGGLSVLTTWPYFVLTFAVAHFWHPDVSSTGRRTRAGAVWLLMVAGWGILTVEHAFGLHYGNSWPLLLIGGGISLVWHALEEPGRCGGPHGSRS